MRYREYSEVAVFGLCARFLFSQSLGEQQYVSNLEYDATASNVRW